MWFVVLVVVGEVEVVLVVCIVLCEWLGFDFVRVCGYVG